ncbi:40S ribosomal protein S3 [Eumeta japonica]|uniref:Small ribosomal subunit protein uS3 n=1 Tax=Eumeta variegata TaxID=151549 RepID=A0A4C1YIL9_EUMVA|nr:40S ribosomal protein S3 [Eumeta japonica]
MPRVKLVCDKFYCGRAILWPTWLQHKNGPAQPLKYHILTEYGREVASSLLFSRFVGDGVFKAELNEFLTRELAEDGYSGVEVRVTPTRSEIIIMATRTQSVLGEKGRRIRELTSVVQKRFNIPEQSVELYAEKVATRGLCAIAQAESLRYKLIGGLAVRRACYGVLRFIMESGARGCEVVVSGKLRGQRAKSMKFVDGLMIHSGDPCNDYVNTATRHVLLRQGVLGIKHRCEVSCKHDTSRGSHLVISESADFASQTRAVPVKLSGPSPLTHKYKIWRLGNNAITYKKMGFNRTKYEAKQNKKRVEEIIHQFYEDDNNSRCAAGKKECITHKKNKKQKRYLLDSLKNLHQKFLNTSLVKIGYDSFCKLRPFWVVVPKLTDRERCPNIQISVIEDVDIEKVNRMIKEHEKEQKAFKGTLLVHQVLGHIYNPNKLVLKSLSCFRDNVDCNDYNLGTITYQTNTQRLQVSDIYTDSEDDMPLASVSHIAQEKSKTSYGSGDYVLVKLIMGRKEYRYAAICSKYDDDEGELTVTFLKVCNEDGTEFKINDNDIADVPYEDVIEKLPIPNLIVKRGKVFYKFKTPVKIMLPWDQQGKNGPKKPQPDHILVTEPKDEPVPLEPTSDVRSVAPVVQPVPPPVAAVA